LLAEFRLNSAEITTTIRIITSTLEKMSPVATPPIENKPPNIVAKIAVITPKMAPNRPITTPNMAAPSPIRTPPRGMANSNIKGSRIMNKRILINNYIREMITIVDTSPQKNITKLRKGY